MGIINKENIRNAIKNPFIFIVLILLIVLAIANSFIVGCLIASIIGIFIALLGNNPNPFITSFCNNDSWKIGFIDNSVKFLGDNIILIIILSLIVWVFLNFTEKGKKIISFLD